MGIIRGNVRGLAFAAISIASGDSRARLGL